MVHKEPAILMSFDIGFIGLGIMGRPMARHLLKAGHKVTVYNRTASKAQELAAEGAKVAADYLAKWLRR